MSTDKKHDAAQSMAEAVIRGGGTLAQAVIAAATAGAMTRDELTHDEKVSADLTVAAILAASAVAMWNEPCQSYYCLPCAKVSRITQWQPVPEDAANAIAKELGRHACDMCGKEIGNEHA